MGHGQRKTSGWLIALTLWGATACITVKQSPEVAPSDDAGAALDATLPKDGAGPGDGGTSDGTAADSAVSCPAQGALGFCENFDDKALPGAFDREETTRGVLALGAIAGPPATTVLRSSLMPSTAESFARLYKSFPTAKDLEVEFDFLPGVLHTGTSPASSFVTQVIMQEQGGAANSIVIGGVQLEATQGKGSLFAMRYNGKGDSFQKVGVALPVVVGEWKRLRFRFSRSGDLSLRDVTKNTILAEERVAVPSLLQTGMALTIGAECYVGQAGFSLAYDNVVVTAQ